jgi:hypothetical protein
MDINIYYINKLKTTEEIKRNKKGKKLKIPLWTGKELKRKKQRSGTKLKIDKYKNKNEKT